MANNPINVHGLTLRIPRKKPKPCDANAKWTKTCQHLQHGVNSSTLEGQGQYGRLCCDGRTLPGEQVNNTEEPLAWEEAWWVLVKLEL